MGDASCYYCYIFELFVVLANKNWEFCTLLIGACFLPWNTWFCLMDFELLLLGLRVASRVGLFETSSF